MQKTTGFYRYLLYSLLSVVGLVMNYGCRESYCSHPVVLQAEAVLFSYPDSAFHLLQSIPHPEQLTAKDYAAWCLHYMHSRYKLGMDIGSDSMAVNTLKYYRDNYSAKYTGIAWYLYGISIEAKNIKNSILAYKYSFDCLESTDENDLKGLVAFSIGSLYDREKVISEALKYTQLSLRYFELSGNLKYQAYAMNAMVDFYCTLGYSHEKYMKLLDQSIHLARLSGDSLIYYYTIGHKAEMLYNTDCYQSKELFLKVFSQLQGRRASNAAYLSYLYSRLNKRDSAIYYQKIASINDNIIDRNVYYMFKAYVHSNTEDYKQAFTALEKSYMINDSLYQATNAHQLARLDKQYDLTQKTRENDRLKIANQWNTIVIFALLALVLAGVVVFLVIRDRMRKKQVMLELRNKELEIENRHKSYVNEQKRQALLLKLHAQIKNTLQFQRLQSGYHESKKHEDFLSEITRQSVIGATEWDFYFREVNQLSDGRLQRLREEAHQLTGQDVIVICLICLGLDITRSCNLLNMTVNTMYQRRKRIKMRVGFTEDIELWAKTTIGDWDVEAVDPDTLWVLDE